MTANQKPSLLEKLEAGYLNILRVVIIVLATVLLAGSVVAVAVAAPMLLTSLTGKTNPQKLVHADHFSDYLTEKRGQPVQPETMTTGSDQVVEPGANTDKRVLEAAANIATYVQRTRGTPVVQAAVVNYINQKAASLPSSLFDDYADSLLRLSKDLLAAGPSTSSVDVDEVVEWHYAKFSEATEAAAARDAANQAQAVQQRVAAAGAVVLAMSLFGTFLLLVFVFVLVKIERNLRLLPVRLESADA